MKKIIGEQVKLVKQAFYLADIERGDNVNYELEFYDRFRERIAGIKNIEERNSILSDMQENFTKQVRNEPDNRDKLSRVYQLLKMKCWEVSA